MTPMNIDDVAQLAVQNTLLEMLAVAMLAKADDPGAAVVEFTQALGAKIDDLSVAGHGDENAERIRAAAKRYAARFSGNVALKVGAP